MDKGETMRFTAFVCGITGLLYSLSLGASSTEYSSSEEDLMPQLEEAAAHDAATLEHQKSATALQKENIKNEDPLEMLPQGAKEVIGNEANPAFSIIVDMAGAYFSASDRHRQGGHAPTTNGPAIQGVELAASASIDPYFKIDMAFGLYHLHLEEIVVTTTALPWNLQVRAGQFKSNIGRHNPTHLHSWHFVTHPLANQFMFGSEGMGLPGVELSVLLPLPWYMEVIGALQMGEAGAFRTDFSGDPGFKDFIYPTRLVQFFDLHDDIGLQWGLNAVFGTSQSAPEQNNRTYAYGTDLLLKWRPIGHGQTGYTHITWITEAWFRQMEVPGDVWGDLGGYTDLIFGLNKRWEIALRGELWRQIQGNRTNDDVNRDSYGLNAVRGNGAVSFMPSHFSRVRLQYAFENMDAFDLNHIVLLQLEVSAGAHGAHKY